MKPIHNLVLLATIGAVCAADFDVEISQLTTGPRHHFFGYIGHVQNVPWSGDGRYIVALRTSFQDRMPEPGEPADVVLIDTQNANRIEKIDESRAWNFQQGTMFYWNPSAADRELIFNDRDPVTHRVFTVIYDVVARKRVREFRFDDTPIGNSGVAQRGGTFLGLNYGRMARLRPVTGYPGAFDWNPDETAPADDGVFIVDLNTGEKRLLVSFADLAGVVDTQGRDLFINHTLWSRDDSHIYFYVRGDFGSRARKLDVPVSIRSNGTGLSTHRYIGGHPEWLDGTRVIGSSGDQMVVYDVEKSQIVETLGGAETFPKVGGDVALSPDSKWLVVGDRRGEENFYVVFRRADRARVQTRGFPHPGYASGDLRVDGLPCWNRTSDGFLFPAIANDGTRQLFLGAIRRPTAGAGSPPANVLFIAVDDLNDWIGCLRGHPQALTPNLDRLAARGVLFANAHCAAPACNPSRAAVFSGLMPHRTGVWSNQSGRIDRLKPDAVLLPSSFSEAGYRTLGTGKLLHSGSRGMFDEYFGVGQRWSPLPGQAVEYTDAELPTKASDNPRHVTQDSRGREVILPLNRMPSDRNPATKAGESFDWGGWDVPDSDFGDTQITDWAIARIQERSAKPFFLGVGYYRPHIPLWAPKRFFERFRQDPGKLPPFREDDLDDLSAAGKRWALEPVTAGSHATVLKHAQWRQAVEAYLACVTYVDHEIGRLLDALDSSSRGDNTVIILWSDHGWHLGEKEHWGKWTGWERSTKVPLIMVPPRTQADRFAQPGSRCDQPVGLIDLYPTLLELCGVPGPAGLDGESLVPLLRQPDRTTDRAVLTAFDRGNTSLRADRWRYLRYNDGSEELYDLQEDPNEWTNLASVPERASLKRTLATVLDRRLKAVER